MPEPDNTHPAALTIESLLRQCDIDRTRRSGPGGQHRNKVETAVTIHHRPTGVTGQAGERRSQTANQRQAIRRLRINLAIAIRTPVDESARPSNLWQSRTRNGRIAVNVDHEDYPAILAEALNFIAARDFDVKPAADRLNTTASQLVKLIQTQPRAIEWVNEQRQAIGLRSLR